MLLKKHRLVLGLALAVGYSFAHAADPAPTAPVAAPPPPTATAAATAPGAPVTSDPATVTAVATVNGIAIPKALFDHYAEQIKARGENEAVDATELVEDLIQQELLIQEAQKQQLLKPEELAMQLETMRRNLLARAAVQHILGTLQPTEEAMKKEYDALVTSMNAQEYQVRHILVASEADAQQVIEALKQEKGENFEALAKARSTDSSKDQGGELGWVSASDLPPTMGEALSQLQKDQHSEEPVQTEHGWHVLKVDDVRAATPPSFDELQPALMEKVQETNIQNYLKELRSKAIIEVVKP